MTTANGQQKNHPDYTLATALETLARRIRARHHRPHLAAKAGLQFMTLAAQNFAVSRLNELSEIANGEGGGELSERTMDLLFEDHDVADALIPMILDKAATTPMFDVNITRAMGTRTMESWRRIYSGRLFADENIATERARNASFNAKNDRIAAVSSIKQGRLLALEF